MAPTPAAAAGGRKPRARKRPKGAPTHVRSWPLAAGCGAVPGDSTRFFTGARVYNAVLGEFIGRSRAVKSRSGVAGRATAAAAHQRGTGCPACGVPTLCEQAHGFTADAAQSYASSLRRSWVREHLPAQETQNLGGRAFDAVNAVACGSGKAGRGSSQLRRGLHSLAAKDGNGALRPKTDAPGRLVGLQWGAGFVSDDRPAGRDRAGAVRSSRPSGPRSRR